MRLFLRLFLWLSASLLTLTVAISFYTRLTTSRKIPGLIRQQPLLSDADIVSFTSLPHSVFEIRTALAKEDARPRLINSYLAHHNSPMKGLGEYIVKQSEARGVDPYLIVAIAQQESNLGKLMPEDCHNAWGWGIHSQGTLCFDTWTEGITTYITGLSDNYLAYGLTTPEEIMTKYNPGSPNGSWAKGVNYFLSELNSGDF